MASTIDQAEEIQIGAQFPSLQLTLVTSKVDDSKAADGACVNINRDFTTVNSNEYFANKKIVLVSVPGAFTPTCSERHLPGFIQKYDELKSKGVDEVIFLSVNDKFVMRAWSQALDATGKVIMLADAAAEVAKALGLAFDGSAFGLGIRARRFALVIENNVVKVVNVEKPSELIVSSADGILAVL